MVGKKKHSAAAASTSGVKRTRAETAAIDDDDAFEAGPTRARSQQAAPTAAVAAEEPGEMMDQCRICPWVLVYPKYFDVILNILMLMFTLNNSIKFDAIVNAKQCNFIIPSILTLTPE